MAGSRELEIRSRGVMTFLLRRQAGQGEVLLLLRHDGFMAGQWHPVTGHLEAGETAWQAALRELHEETGVIPDRFYHANLIERFYDIEADCVELMPVFVAYLDQPRAVRLNAEHSDFRWLAPAEAFETIKLPSLRGTFKDVVESFIERQPLERLRISLSGD